MSKHYLSKRSHEEARRTQADREQRDELRLLVARYEVVRLHRGPEHDEAERRLGVALAKYGPFKDGELHWQWSKTQDSILRTKALLTNHPNGGKRCER